MGRGSASGWNMEFCFQRTIGSIHVVTMDFNLWDMKGNKLEFHKNGAFGLRSDLQVLYGPFRWNSVFMMGFFAQG